MTIQPSLNPVFAIVHPSGRVVSTEGNVSLLKPQMGEF